MSTHRVEVIRVKDVVKHPNADTLGLVQIEGFTAIVKLGDIKPGDLCVYIEPDYVVPDTQQFAFLKGKLRIKSQKLRGVWSQGLLVKADPDMKEGECVMKRLGIVRYEPPMKAHHRGGKGGSLGRANEASVPKEIRGLPIYDLENWRKYRSCFVEGEEVIITEKIHGANEKLTCVDGKMYVGSRRMWVSRNSNTKREKLWYKVQQLFIAFLALFSDYYKHRSTQMPRVDQPDNVWWKALNTNPWISEYCKANPGHILYGEVYGDVQELKYGAKEGEVFFRAFDVKLPDGTFMDADKFVETFGEGQKVPVLYRGPYNEAMVEEMSRMKKSTIADHIAEGVVIKPVKDRHDHRVGRVALKLVSDLYLEKS